MMFDYDNQPDADAIPVADAIRSQYRLPELTPEQQQQRRIDQANFREELAWRDEQRRIQHQERQDEADAISRAEEAAEIAERNKQTRERMRQEYIARQERQSRSNDLAAVRLESQQSALWRNQVQNAIAYQNRQTLISELESALCPPQPQPSPGPEVIYVEQPADDTVKLHRWFDR